MPFGKRFAAAVKRVENFREYKKVALNKKRIRRLLQKDGSLDELGPVIAQIPNDPNHPEFELMWKVLFGRMVNNELVYQADGDRSPEEDDHWCGCGVE